MKFKKANKNINEKVIKINFNKPLTDKIYYNFLKKIYILRFLCKNKKLCITLNNKKINIAKEKDQRIINIYHIEKAINIKDKKQRYEYIYDVVCNYLDESFQKGNLCEFINNQCLSDRNKKFKKSCGCCCENNNNLCEYLENDHCTIKCISCKLFTCPALKRNRIKFRIKDIPLLNYFFNLRQKEVLVYTFFTPKEKIIEKLIKFRL